MITVALYARVSTKDKAQSAENQLPELRRFAQATAITHTGSTWSRSQVERVSARSYRPSLPMRTNDIST
jgi:DNA invertase Pin-like site-specific DNA recombinase